MANKFQKGHTFVPGEVVDPDDLNNLVDLATALPPLITDQTPVSAATGDKVLVVRGTPGQLRQADVSTFPSGVTTVNFNATPGNIFDDTVTPPNHAGDVLISLSLAQQTGNKVLAAPADGSTGAVAFRALVPKDTAKEVTLAAGDAGVIINCTLGSSFVKQLSGHANTTITLHVNNGLPGQIVSVYVFQGNNPAQTLVNWTTDDTGPNHGVRWPGGTDPVMTRYVVGASDVYTFRCVGTGLYFGTFAQNFLP